jgi:hypothetical protein
MMQKGETFGLALLFSIKLISSHAAGQTKDRCRTDFQLAETTNRTLVYQ